MLLAQLALAAPATATLAAPRQLEVGAPLPDLELPTVDGDATLRLSSFRGRPLLVVHLASWSEACREHVRVWDELTRPWRESGELALVGLAEEQQRERAALFARWQGFDWPILWDPLDLAGVDSVPALVFVDAHGIVRDTTPHPERFEATCLQVEFPAPEPAPPDAPPPVRAELLDAPGESRERAYAALLFGDASALDDALAALEASDGASADPWASFRIGVARTLRHDSEHVRPGDLQRATLLHNTTRPALWRILFESLAFKPELFARSFAFDHFPSIAAAAVGGLGVALLPKFAIEEELQTGQLVTLFDTGLGSMEAYFLVVPVRKVNNELVACFRKWLLSESEAERAGIGLLAQKFPLSTRGEGLRYS